ncbi:MAG: trypsin-like peptidase domain-containing protein [Nitrososphaerota archaeon]|nr:trypsin-like peptidase domain-containing protein [Nitrososphaerota archaeon]
MTPERSGGRNVLFAVAVIALIAGSGLTFAYFGLANAQTASNPSTASLQSKVASLENSNAALQAQLTALNSSSSSQTTPGTAFTAQQIYAVSSPSVVTVQGDQSTTVSSFFGPQTTITPVLGSGFVISYQNSFYIATNYHVVAGDSNLTVTFPDGNAYPAQIVGTDPYSDLAVLKVSSAPGSEFVSLQLVPSTDLSVGQAVYAIGNPYGLSGSMTPGIISQLGRTIQDPVAGNFSVAGVIQFSAPINPGNSGGPLLDANGKVVGITTATVSSSQGIGFAIPSSTILRDLPSLVKTGTYSEYSYIGITTVDMSYQLAVASHTNVTYGVLIESVVPGGPAAKAGLRAGTTTVTIEGTQYLVGGDIIVSVNGTKIINQDALSTYLVQNTTAGQTVDLGVIRSGTLISVTMVTGARPPA